MGGIDFQCVESFNKAHLAKQIWRIIANPRSLVARVLKARYFKYQDVMKAKLGSNPSLHWRSMLWSKKLLNKRIWWRVCDGKKYKPFLTTGSLEFDLVLVKIIKNLRK